MGKMETIPTAITSHQLLTELLMSNGLESGAAIWVADVAVDTANRAMLAVGCHLQSCCQGDPPPLLLSCAVTALLHEHLALVEAEIAEQLELRGEDPARTCECFDLAAMRRNRQDAVTRRA